MTAQGTDTDRLAEITKRAAEIAALVPEHLQEAAFNQAFGQLTEGTGAKASGPPSKKNRGTRSGQRRRSTAQAERSQEDSSDPTSVLINSLSRTDCPEISKATRALDRALHLLRVAQADYGIDGMTAPQIAKVLTDKFRQRVSRQAINQALDAAGDYVDRTPQAKGGTVYRLMAPGEDYLAGGGAGSKEQKEPAATTKRRKGRGRPRTTPKAEAGQEKSSGRKRSGRRPKALVEELIADGFFTEPRTISDIQERLRHKKGIRLKATDLSPVLVRLLREKALDRERNESNQYEYRAPS